MEEANVEFCNDICLAARKLRIPLRLDIQPGGFRYQFLDGAANKLIEGSFGVSKEDALFFACQSLQKHLCITP